MRFSDIAARFGTAAFILLAMWLQSLVSGAQAADMPDRPEMTALLKAQNFAKLEKHLAAIQAAFEDGRVSDGQVARAFNAFGNSDSALQAPLEAWIDRFPNSASARLARGMYLEHLGWLSRGSKYVQETPRAQFERMRDYFRLANSELRRALDINPRLTPATTALMRIAMASGTREEVKALFEAGLAVSPKSHGLHIQYLHALRPEWGGSVRAVKEHVALLAVSHPEPAAKYMQGFYDFVLGGQAERRGDLKTALAHFDRALEYGIHTDYLKNRGYVRLRLGMGDAAREDMRRAVAILPHTPEYLGALADVEMFTNRPREVIDALTLAIANDSLNPEFRKDRAHYFVYSRDRRAEAEADLEAAMVFGDLDPSILRVSSRLYVELHNVSKAVELAKRALDLAPNDSRSMYEYAQALYFNQDCKAHEAYAQFRRMCPRDNHCDAEKGMAMPGVLPYFRCEAAALK
jgi:tetratricopeptide (TPR) repeat protein